MNMLLWSARWHLYCQSLSRNDFWARRRITNPMRPRKLVQVTISVATVLVWGSAWVLAAGQSAGQSGASPQQNPSASAQNPVAPAGSTATETPYPGSTTAQRAEGKEKHWSGTLVDVNC